VPSSSGCCGRLPGRSQINWIPAREWLAADREAGGHYPSMRAPPSALIVFGRSAWRPRRDSNPRFFSYQGSGLPPRPPFHNFELRRTAFLRTVVQWTVSYPSGSFYRSTSPCPSNQRGKRAHDQIGHEGSCQQLQSEDPVIRRRYPSAIW